MRRLSRNPGIAFIVLDDKFDLTTIDAACRVHSIKNSFGRCRGFWKSKGSSNRAYGPDPYRLRRLRAGQTGNRRDDGNGSPRRASDSSKNNLHAKLLRKDG